MRHVVEPYIGSSPWRASFQLVTTLVPLAAGVWAVHAVRSWSLVAALLLTVVVAGLLVRTFVLMHDCAHGSFFRSRRVNDVVGFVTGVLTLTRRRVMQRVIAPPLGERGERQDSGEESHQVARTAPGQERAV